MSEGKLELMAAKNFTSSPELYKVVDFLNKTLKDQNLLFGLSKVDEVTSCITIYQT